jgi:hypothetical protein
MKIKFKNKLGVTLLELMIVVMLLTFVFGGAFMYLKTQTETALITQQDIEMQSNSREPLKFMKDEIAVAGAIPEAANPPPAGVILTLADTQIVFQGDIDSDEDTDKVEYNYDSEGEVISRTQWQWNSTTMEWDPVGETEDIALNVIDCSFEFYDENDDETNDEASVRKVVIMLETGESGERSQMTGGKSGTRPLVTSVFLRNAMLGA